jgi:arylsulfatase A-like enzyme
MGTVDEEFLTAAIDFIEQEQKQGKPWFVWFNTTRLHIFTHLKDESAGVTGHGIYADGMVEHDGHVGRLLDTLDELGVTDNTIVIYTTDNGAEKFSWPDGGTSPFRGEKATTWEGGIHVPFMIKWPAKLRVARSRTRSCRWKTCYRRRWPRAAMRTSSRNCLRDLQPAARHSRFTLMAITCCRI